MSNNINDYYNNLVLGGKTMAEWDAEEQAQSQYNSEDGIAYEDAVNLGLLEAPQEQQPTEEPREFEKLSVGKTIKDVGTTVGKEAAKVFVPTKDGLANKALDKIGLGGFNEDNLNLNYQSKTRVGETFKYLYRYGAGTIAFMYGGGLVGAGVKAAGVLSGSKNTITLGKGIQKLMASDKLFKTSKGGAKAAGVWLANNALGGATAGAMADFALYNSDEGHLADMFGNAEWARPFQTQEDDNWFEGRMKNVVEGLVTGGLIGVTVAPALRTLGAKWFKANKKAVTTESETEAFEALQEAAEIGQQIKQITGTSDVYNSVKELKAKADLEGTDVEELINNNIPSEYQTAAKEMLDLMNQGEDIFINADGTFDIKVTNWEDAAKVSKESYEAQLRKADEVNAKSDSEVRYGDTAIEHMDAATKSTWENRGWLGDGDSSLVKVKTDKDGNELSRTVNKTTANKIVKHYTDKWEIDNKIKVEVVDGLKDENGNPVAGRTDDNTYHGKKVKNKANAEKKLQTKIDAQKLKVDKAQDRVTMLKGGNTEVMEDLEVAVRELEIAKKQLADLENDLKELKSPDKLYDITISIDANCKNPHAVLRSELEHARDIAKGTVPDQSKQHFSRYNGLNEGEVASGYTYKKSQGKAKKIAEQGVDNTGVKYNQEIINESTRTDNNTSGINSQHGKEPISNSEGNIPESNSRVDSIGNTTDTNLQPTHFNSIEDVAEAASNGSFKHQTAKEVDNFVMEVADTFTPYQKTTWEELCKAVDNDPVLKEIMESLDPDLVLRYSGNPNELVNIVKRELGTLKLHEAYSQLLLNTTDKAKSREIMEEMYKLKERVEAYRSYSGLVLNVQKATHKIEEAYAKSVLTGVDINGIKQLSDIIRESTKNISLNFTQGEFVKKKQEVLAAILSNASVEVLRLYGNAELRAIFNDTVEKMIKEGHFNAEAFELNIKNAVLDMHIDEVKNAAKQAPTKEGQRKTILTWKGWQSYYVHNLLSGVGTICKNVLSGAINTLYFPVKKMLAGAVFGGGDAMYKEGLGTLNAMLSSWNDAYLLAKQAFINGEGVMTNIGKDTMAETQQAAFNKWGKEDASILEHLQNLHSFMTRLMGATDEFMSQFNYRSIVKSKAYLQAEELAKTVNKQNDQQWIQEQAKKFFDSSFDNTGRPSDINAYYESKSALYQAPLNGQAFDGTQMREQTWAMAAGESINNAIASKAPALKFLFPFVKTGVNILQMNLDHNALYALFSKSQRDLFFSKTAEGALARSQVAFGAFSMTIATAIALCGGITGSLPRDPKERKALLATGWRPYSIVTPDGKYISYQGYEPLHTILGFAADIVELGTSIATDEDYMSMEKVINEGWGVILNNFLDKAAFRSGVSALNIIFDTDGSTLENLKKLGANTAAGLLPDASFVKGLSTFGERDVKSPKTFMDRWLNMYFNRGLGEYRRNCFGEKQNVTNLIISNGSSLEHTPENDELLRLAEYGFKPSEITDVIAKTNYNFKDFKDENGRNAYDYMMEALSNSGLREAVRDLVTSPSYQELPDGILTDKAKADGVKFLLSDDTKINALKALFIEYNNRVKEEVMSEHPELMNQDGVSLGEAQNESLSNKLNLLINQGMNDNLDELNNFY